MIISHPHKFNLPFFWFHFMSDHRHHHHFVNMSQQIATIATNLNNEGISRMDSADYEGAASAFSKGLSIVKRALASPEWDDLSSKALDQAANQDTPACQFYKLQSFDSDMLIDQDEQQDWMNQDGFVFNEPIMVLPQSLETPGYSYFVKLSFIQLYNLALSHHLCALKQPKPKRFLQKALSLYELAYTIHVSEDVELTILQSMAIVNNLGHLHRRLNDQEKSTQCFENLLTTLMFVKDCGDQDSYQLLDGFLSNVISLILCGPKPAPAA